MLLCCPTGVSGAGGPDYGAGLLCVPVGGGPPASRPRRVLMLVAPRVFRAPSGPAAREARRPHFVRRRASKPARALRSHLRPPHQWRLVADVRLDASTRCPARPRHCPRVSQPGPPLPPAPFTPAAVGGFALHEAFWGCAVGVSDPHVVQFPPIGGGEAAT